MHISTQIRCPFIWPSVLITQILMLFLPSFLPSYQFFLFDSEMQTKIIIPKQNTSTAKRSEAHAFNGLIINLVASALSTEAKHQYEFIADTLNETAERCRRRIKTTHPFIRTTGSIDKVGAIFDRLKRMLRRRCKCGKEQCDECREEKDHD
jgi:hypothetical protein